MFKNKTSSIELFLVISAAIIVALSIGVSYEVLADQKFGQNTSDNESLQTQPKVKYDAKLVSQLPISGGNIGNNSFKMVDVNNNGKITFKEFQDYNELVKQENGKRDADQLIKRCDKDKDGMISLSELPTEETMNDRVKNSDLSFHCMLPKEILELMDLNEDGLLTLEEAKKGLSSNHQPNKKVKKKLQKKMLSKEATRRKKEFSHCDTNFDEILTLREAMSKNCSLHLYTEQFDAYDTNSDLILTLEEIAKEAHQVKATQSENSKLIERRKNMPPLERLQSAFFDCDADEDDRLNKAETIEARCEQDLAYFDTVDYDLDGYITHNELQRMKSKEQFDNMDKNKNGHLEEKEYKSLIQI